MYTFNKSRLHVKSFQLPYSPPSGTQGVKSNLLTSSTKSVLKGGNENCSSQLNQNVTQKCDNQETSHVNCHSRNNSHINESHSHVKFNIVPPSSQSPSCTTLKESNCNDKLMPTKDCGCQCKPIVETKCDCNNECSPITVSDLLNVLTVCDQPEYHKAVSLILSNFSNLPAKLFISRWASSTPVVFKPHCYGMLYTQPADVTHPDTNTDCTQITGVSADSQTLCLRTIITCSSRPRQWELFPFGDWATPTPIDDTNSVRVYVYAPIIDSPSSCNKGEDNECKTNKYSHHSHVPTAVASTYTPCFTSPNSGVGLRDSTQCEADTIVDGRTNVSDSTQCNCDDSDSADPSDDSTQCDSDANSNPQCKHKTTKCTKCNSQACTCTVTVHVEVCQSCKQPKDACTCVPQHAYKLYVCCAKWESRKLSDSKCGRPSCTYVLCLDQKSLCEYDCNNKEVPFTSGLDGLQSHLIFYVNNETVKLL